MTSASGSIIVHAGRSSTGAAAGVTLAHCFHATSTAAEPARSRTSATTVTNIFQHLLEHTLEIRRRVLRSNPGGRVVQLVIRGPQRLQILRVHALRSGVHGGEQLQRK